MSASLFLIYVLSDPRLALDDERQRFYIGQTQRGLATRLKQHHDPRRFDSNPRKRILFAELYAAGLQYRVGVLEEFTAPPAGATPAERLPFQQALALGERRWIQNARSELGSKLLNITNGGENVVGPTFGMRGRVVSSQTRQKIREAQIGKFIPIESRERMREAHKGKRLSAEHKAKIADAARGCVFTDERRAKISAYHKNRPPEFRAKIAENNRRRIISEETRAKMVASQRRRFQREAAEQ